MLDSVTLIAHVIAPFRYPQRSHSRRDYVLFSSAVLWPLNLFVSLLLILLREQVVSQPPCNLCHTTVWWTEVSLYIRHVCGIVPNNASHTNRVHTVAGFLSSFPDPETRMKHSSETVPARQIFRCASTTASIATTTFIRSLVIYGIVCTIHHDPLHFLRRRLPSVSLIYRGSQDLHKTGSRMCSAETKRRQRLQHRAPSSHSMV